MPDQREAPPLDYGIWGWTPLPRLRARAAWFGTLVDQLWEHEDGSRQWRRYRGPLSISELSKLKSEENAA